jgi:MFS family permease
MVATSTDKLITHFVIELSQNLYFIGVLLTYLLWGAMMKLRENRTRLMQLVLTMGVYFSAFAGSYALGNMYPNLALWRYICHLMVMWLPLSWAYTFTKVREDTRMATARVLASNR